MPFDHNANNWWDQTIANFRFSKEVIPGTFAPPFLGLSTGGKMAAALDTTSLGQWATGGFGGSTSGLASFTSLETGTLALGSAALNYLAVAATWEAGTFVGSAVAATIQQIWPEVRK